MATTTTEESVINQLLAPGSGGLSRRSPRGERRPRSRTIDEARRLVQEASEGENESGAASGIEGEEGIDKNAVITMLLQERQDKDAELEENEREIEELHNKITELAQIGQHLLEDKQHYEETLQQSTSQYNNLLQEYEKATGTITTLKEANEELVEKVNGMGNNSINNEIVKVLTKKYELLEDQLNEALSENKRVLGELKEKNEQIETLKSKTKEITQLAESNKALESDLLDLRQKFQKSHQDYATLQRENSKLQLARQESETSLESRLQQAKQEMESKQVVAPKKSVVDDLKNQLNEAMQELEIKDQHIGQVKLESKRLEEGLASLIRENQRLCDERDENLRFLEDARSTIATLRQDIHDHHLASATEGGDNSILGELQRGLEQKLADKKEQVEAARKNSPVISRKAQTLPSEIASSDPLNANGTNPPPDTEKPGPTVAEFGLINCEEYFLMAATAVKIGMAVKHPHVSDRVFQINSRHLFKEAATLDIPFHEWHFWIVDRFSEKLKEYQLELAKKGVMLGIKDESRHPIKPAPASAKNPVATKSSPQEEENSLIGMWNSFFNKK